MKIIYEQHPVTPERKAELAAAGYKIIDARFAPVGESVGDTNAPTSPQGKSNRGRKK